VLNPIAIAVPFFFLLIGAEMLWAKKKKVRVYRFVDAITDLSCGIVSQIDVALLGATIFGLYLIVYQHRLFTIRPVWAQWLVAFFTVDFVYYWWHRASHEVNFMWAAHVVHHQSEDYNLAVALRQAVLTSWTIIPFHMPLALIGVPPTVFALAYALSTLYQFWIHTELMPKVGGIADKVFNLPHHHRVHHAINPRYLDKNYGATLIIWDRLFRTHEDETEDCIYGITKPLGSFNPLWAQIHYFFDMADYWKKSRGLEKLGAIFASPAWKPKGHVLPPARDLNKASYAKFSVYASAFTKRYVLVQYVVIATATFFVMAFSVTMDRTVLYLASASIVLGLASLGGLLEHKTWATGLEAFRLLVGGAAVAVFVMLRFHH
jgi:sterol desaturase/sphingolipid hydroxylase (fatty acid hydroxylase superfamily)